MDRRTYEGHMDWEYQHSGPVDPTSPYFQLTKNNQKSIFSTPSKSGSAFSQGTFGKWGSSSPSKYPQPPQSTLFAPAISPSKTAPPLRNPAFTTPRKPFDELVLSEASGAEESPAAMTDVSDMTNDTPEVDSNGDVNMHATITPSKVSKAQRYGKSGPLAKKHASGKGELMRQRELTSAVDMRKRKRHNYDKDVGRLARHYQDDSGGSDGSYPGTSRDRNHHDGSENSTSYVGNMLRSMRQHKDAPQDLWNWVHVVMRATISLIVAGGILSIAWAIRADLLDASEEWYQNIMRDISECTESYKINQCASNEAPALRSMCNDWYHCMSQSTDSRRRLHVLTEHVADLCNTFVAGIHWRTWAVVGGFILLSAVSGALAGRTQHSSTPAVSGPPAPSNPVSPEKHIHFHNYGRSQNEFDEGTDTDSTPPRGSIMPSGTPSRLRSPHKERSGSPVKYRGSPSKLQYY